ncbi:MULTISPECIES: flagellar hook-associated protein FlgL [Burkholderia cepacia complex]|uniref:Flagellar hook-associated protein 3 n=1 Tax=Burkholderia orbicola (strain MC0-3) TaxID=406425 RepID=B1K3D6_BURO0|nr:MULTISPECIES: flagellar hook-associated protein FlgL [Burkholderia cepacia complex]ACA93815.1 flagellar hook-associated protein 3 [Burkholderia orbicola MC0-3]MCA8085849.1 flagellar hook-associated protein FlgL [Burkholderia cenocepacia]
MRIASQHFGNTMLATLRASNSKAADLTSKISTGQRVQRASDDPIAAARLLLIERDTSVLQRYQKNIDTLSVRLQKNEVHLDGMLDTVMAVHDSLLSAADGSRSAADLNALAAPLRMRLNNLKQAANAKDGDGNFLFSGSQTNTAPIAYDATAPVGSRYSYAGNGELQQVVIGHGVTQHANVTVESLADVMNKLEAAIEAMEDPEVNPSAPAVRGVLTAALDSVKHNGIDALSVKITDLGGAQNTLDLMSENHSAQLVANGQAVSLVGELDFAEAIDQLNNYIAAVKGSYAIYTRMTQLSLFDAI